MEVKIGIQFAQRELTVDTDTTAEEVESQLSAALADNGVIRLTDTRGRIVVVPAAKLAYLEFGSTTTGAVGFR